MFEALSTANRGETYIPRVPSARVVDVARALIGQRDIPIVKTGVRPGEKIHEILISEEECHRTVLRGKYYAIKSILPELHRERNEPVALEGEYSSAGSVMTLEETFRLLEQENLLIPEEALVKEELLR